MPRNLAVILILCFVFALTTPVRSEEPDWDRVEKELVSLLRKLIKADTQNPPGNEARVTRILKDFFRQEGITSRNYSAGKNRANFIARLYGNGELKPFMLAAHSDVVPADTTDWTAPPFSGTVVDGYLYGRGALDDKGRLAVNAVTMALLKREGIPLRRDVIFLATAGEETGGKMGAGWMLERYRDKLDAAFAVNEGGRIVLRHGQPLYIAIQTEEKVAYNITLTVSGTTGHASVPRIDNAIFGSAVALERLARVNQPKMLDPVTAAFFRGVAEIDPDVSWIDGSPVTENATYLALLTNTISPTGIAGGVKSNVHPPTVEVNLNCRLLPQQNVDAFVDSLRAWSAPGPYEFTYTAKPDAPPASPQDGTGYILLEQVCREMFPDTPVLPYLSPGMTDGRRFRYEGIPTYGLLPFPLEEDEVWRMHGVDERVSLEALMTGMKLTWRLAVLAGS